MTRHGRARPFAVSLALALAVGLAVGAAHAARAQTLFLSGQTIQPVFEGWEQNPDGTFSMYFGYLNRNYQEEPDVPVGPNNFFEPGPADRGQPTYFYPRRQSFVFRVVVPADWGRKDLVWTVNHNGKALTALGTLLPHWVLDDGVWRANRGSGINGRTSAAGDSNEPPSIKRDGGALRAAVGEPVTVAVSVTDDGRPGPRPPRRTRQPVRERVGAEPVVIPGLPTLGGPRSNAASGTGGPSDQNIVKVSAAFETGLAVTWFHYRGPGRVSFDPMVAPIAQPAGTASTTMRFSEPGTHVIRVVADDTIRTTPVDLTVTVTPGGADLVRR
jgi:hypothetical protein